jgi:hypothetical protein
LNGTAWGRWRHHSHCSGLLQKNSISTACAVFLQVAFFSFFGIPETDIAMASVFPQKNTLGE